jgi:hypothetical protein
MIDFDKLQRDITRDNALDMLREVACPACGSVGAYQLCSTSSPTMASAFSAAAARSSFEALQACGIGMQAHHTRPFAGNGESYAKIPL